MKPGTREGMDMTPELQVEWPLERWARLKVDVHCPLRRGGWYRARSVGPEEVVLEVRLTSVIVPRSYVEVVSIRPSKWSLVRRRSGAPYAVCPDCAERVDPTRIDARGTMSCPRCHGSHPVDFTEQGLTADYHRGRSRSRAARPPASP